MNDNNILDSIKKSGIDSETVKKASKLDKKELINSLSPEDRKKLNEVLNDKQALSDALKSPQAVALIKALFGGKNG